MADSPVLRDLVGKAIGNGRYAVEALILPGGGMADVYRARDRNLGSDVAVKIPRRFLVDQDPGFRKRFDREVDSMVRLRHPNILAVLDRGEHDGLTFIVLPYLSGGTLRDRVDALDGSRTGDATAGPRNLKCWLHEIARALDYIHGQGYVHRDVKPENVLFDAAGHPYLSDLGIAKSLTEGTSARSRLTRAGMLIGTPEYAAPEILSGSPYDRQVDQFSLGVTTYQVLSGRCPFEGSSVVAVWESVKRGPPDLAALVPGVPAAVVAAVRKALSVEPRDRFPSCEAFAREILHAAGRGPSHASVPVSSAAALPARPRVPAAPAAQARGNGGPFINVPIPPPTEPRAQEGDSLMRNTFVNTPPPPPTAPGGPAVASHDPGQPSRRRALISVALLAMVLVTAAVAWSGRETIRRLTTAPDAAAPDGTQTQQPPPPRTERSEKATVTERESSPAPDTASPDVDETRQPPPRTERSEKAAVAERKPCPAPDTASPDGEETQQPPPRTERSEKTVGAPSGDSTDVKRPGEVNRPPAGPPGSATEFITTRTGQIKLKLVPAGEFMMGSDATDPEARPTEFVAKAGGRKEKHRVRITRPFYLGVYEVTQAQYKAVMGVNPSYFASSGEGKDKVVGQSTDRHPVDNVSWLDTVEFCNELSKREGLPAFYEIEGEKVSVPAGWDRPGYRLPTEAEWEYACRANTTTPYSFGDGAASLGEFAWYRENSGGKTHPVGEKRPNGFGLYDMHGNVFESCWDIYDLYEHSPVDDPRGAERASHRISRGGCWNGSSHEARSAERSWGGTSGRYPIEGFRLALAQSVR